MPKDLVVMLTALNLEYKAVRRKLTNPQVHRHERGTRFEVGTVPGTSCRVALGLTNKGNHPAAVLAERAIQEFSPVAVLFVGVAGALWETTRLGDVVMATHVYAYHGGTSEDDGLKARPRVWEAPHGISQLGSYLARTSDWVDDMPGDRNTPQVHLGAIAAGEVVQNSRISAEAEWIRQHYNDALAIEMEAAGVAQAGHLNESPVAIIRGISDRADGSKSGVEDHKWQPQAAANAAAFATRLAAELIGEQEQIAMPQDNRDDRLREHVHNTVHSSTVGIMAGSVTGSNVYMNANRKLSSPADLVAELDSFREYLKRHYAEGTLDDDTYREAQSELDTASQAARENGPESPKRVTIALKRLRGLVADSSELAARLAPLIVVVGGLS
ncbi:purine phosphorylase [Streptomyces sp. NPDC014734]|uniref:5'-methylthioadenosine/S-adenosylhomocysteine nucleosidase family protein n=1 Tax=Streptomyces sp. NPDC014734 TaxID=3364886 RepID=UPI0036FEB5F1